MQLPSAFNSNDHEKMGDFTPLPKGEYITNIIASEMKLTKAAQKAKEAGDSNFQKKGQMLVLKHAILFPKEYNKRNLYSRLNLVNENETAVEIANKELATICAAVGKVSVQDSDELHVIPMLLSVDITEDGKYNEIKFYDKAPADLPAEPVTTQTEGGEKKKRIWD